MVLAAAAYFIFTSKTQEEGGSNAGFSIREFLPFGSSDNFVPSDQNEPIANETSNDKENPYNNTTRGQPIPKLRKISNESVAGAIIFSSGTTSLVRFVEKGTGNVYEARSDSLKIDRLTNTTIPKIIRAFWLLNGSGFLAQTLAPESEVIETSFIQLKKNTSATSTESLTPFETTRARLPTGIKEMAIKPDSSKIFYYSTNSQSSNWYISNPDGTGSALVFSHPLRQWLPHWVGTNTIVMQTKSSSNTIGYTYAYNVSNKALEKRGPGVVGMSANPNPDGLFTLVSGGGQTPKLNFIDNRDGTLKETSIQTLADKCVWNKDKEGLSVYCAVPNTIPGASYPDDWYQGAISTEDSVIKIDPLNDIFFNVSDLSRESGQQIDVSDIQISADNKYLIFRNKIDGYLWLLRTED